MGSASSPSAGRHMARHASVCARASANLPSRYSSRPTLRRTSPRVNASPRSAAACASDAHVCASSNRACRRPTSTTSAVSDRASIASWCPVMAAVAARSIVFSEAL